MELIHSNKLIEHAIKDSALSAAERVVLAIICSHSRKTSSGWTCFPSMKTLAVECGMSEETVRKHRVKLESLGYITKQVKSIEGKPKHKRHIYTVVIAKLGFTVDKIKETVKKSKQFLFNMGKAVANGKLQRKQSKPCDTNLSDFDVARRALTTNQATKKQLSLLAHNSNLLSAVERHQLNLAGISL